MNGGDGNGDKRTAMQVVVEIDRSLIQHFDVPGWNQFVADLSRHGLLPAAWAPGERPPPVAIMLDFRRVQRARYRLSGIDLSLCWLEGANFEGSCLKGAKMGCCPNATFRDARLQGADFSDCDVSGCCFVGAELHGAKFDHAVYDPANPPVGLPPELLAVCKPDSDAKPSPAKPQGRPGERPLRATVTISEVPW
jgi:hypothetical protein